MSVIKAILINKSNARVIVTIDNYKGLSDIVLFLKNKGVSAICFSQVDLSGPSSKGHDLLVSAKDMLPHLLGAIKAARREGLACSFEDLPLCLMPGQEDHFILNRRAGIKMQFCLDCELNRRCSGITKAQLIAEYGTQLLSWSFLFPKNFFTKKDMAFLNGQLLRSVNRV